MPNNARRTHLGTTRQRYNTFTRVRVGKGSEVARDASFSRKEVGWGVGNVVRRESNVIANVVATGSAHVEATAYSAP